MLMANLKKNYIAHLLYKSLLFDKKWVGSDALRQARQLPW